MDTIKNLPEATSSQRGKSQILLALLEDEFVLLLNFEDCTFLVQSRVTKGFFFHDKPELSCNVTFCVATIDRHSMIFHDEPKLMM